ncbi:MAG: hypothetical protein JWM53_1838, partial [bacterium]|nr:hypothetical protein [bacterium]
TLAPSVAPGSYAYSVTGKAANGAHHTVDGAIIVQAAPPDMATASGGNGEGGGVGVGGNGNGTDGNGSGGATGAKGGGCSMASGAVGGGAIGAACAMLLLLALGRRRR